MNRVIPKENESLYSLLFRTAKANYFEHITDAIPNPPSFYKLNCNELHGDHQWAEIAEDIVKSANQDINQFVCNKFDDVFFEIDKEKNIRERVILRSYYLRKFTKYCPSCLNEDFYHRLNWDVSFVTTCPVHKIQLILNCPSCKRFISMHSLMSRNCKCGYCFLTASTVKVKSPDILKTQKLLQTALLDQEKNTKRSDGSVLSGREYLHLFSLFYRLLGSLPTNKLKLRNSDGRFEQFLSNHIDMENILIEYMDLLVPLIHELIIAPERKILALFTTIDDLKSNKYGISLASKKSSILKEIFNTFQSGLYSELYAKYTLELKEDYVHRDGFLKLNPLDKNYLGISDAQRLIGRSKSFVLKLCELNMLKYKIIDRNGRETILIEKVGILQWAKHNEEIMSARETRELLGVTHRQYRELIEANHLKVVHGPSIDGITSYFVEKEGVYNLDCSLRSKCKKLSVIDDEWITLDSTKDKIGKEEVSFIELIEMVLNSKVQVGHLKSESPPIIEGLYFSKANICSLRSESFRRFAEEKGYSKMELMRIFNLQTVTANKWFNEGVLKVDYSVRRGSEMLPYVNKKQVIKILTERMGYTEEESLAHLDFWEKSFSSIDHLK